MINKSKWLSLGILGLWLVSLLPISAAAAPPRVEYFQSDEDRIKLNVGGYQFDPLLDGEPAIDPDMSVSNQDEGYYLIQLTGPTQDAWLADITSLGLPILQYYPHFSYLTWGTAEQVAAAERLNFVRWQGALHPAYKVSSDLDGLSGNVQNVDIMFYNDGDEKSTLTQIENLGGQLISTYPSQPDRAFLNVIVEADASTFDEIAQINTVLWLGYVSPVPILDDEMAAQIVAGNYTAGVPYTGYLAHLANLGYDGSGVIWAIIDTGVDYDHPDLNTRIVGGYSFPGACNTNPGDDCAGGGHGTHVAGIVGGDATGGFTDAGGFLYGLGIAPGYSIFAMNSLMGSSWPPSGGWQEHSKQAVLGGAIGGNNSWHSGEGTQHGYQASERTHDFMVLDGNFDTASVAEPFIEVFSAGNRGATGLTAPKEGKNLIVTASSQNFRAGSIDSISSSSSRGPAVDGRWVPTISAPGESIASTRNDLGGSCGTAITGTNGLYSFCSGTSMAAPQTAGAITLATEWWRTFNSNADPSPAMAKALVVNTAIDMGTPDIPNINEGWGRINVTNIISATAPTFYEDQVTVFAHSGEQAVFSVGVPDPSQPLKITLAWSDAPGAVGSNPSLVNNLNLTVENDGTTYLGNNFSGGWSQTGGSADTINNLENVYIQNPTPNITITIDAVNIAGDAILYNADLTDQSFALVCSNCALDGSFTLEASPENQSVCAPASAFYDVDVGSVMGFNQNVSLSALGNPAGTTTNFNPNPVQAPGSSTLTIGNTGAASPGSYSIDIVGTGPTATLTTTVGLDLSNAVPGGVTLVSPSNGATNVPLTPTMDWNSASQADSYLLEIATDPGFGTVVYTDTIQAPNTDHIVTSPLASNTVYYWHIQANNACGAGTFSSTFSFTTLPVAGACAIGSTTNILFSDDFESGAPGWTTGGTGPTWALSSTNPSSPSFHYHADDISSISDQHLISPQVILPTGQDPITLQFMDYQEIEDQSGTGCYDGGILEVSNDGGSNWTQVQDPDLLTNLYDGVVSSTFNNPLAGLNAWCGDPQPYLNNIADLSSYAGDTVQFRFRLGTDASISHPGWDIDDVVVQSCESVPAISVTPGSLTSDQSPDVQMVLPMTITNIGSEDLDWTITEAQTAINPDVDNPTAPAGDMQNIVGDLELASEEAGVSDEPAGTPPQFPLSAALFDFPELMLYDNGPLANCAGCGVGGVDESVLQSVSRSMNTLGFGHQVSQDFRITDDFNVSDSDGWTIDQITVFAYQTGSPITSTISSVNLQIWDGPPDDAGSSVVFGDTTTNRLLSTAWSNIYRVTETTTGTEVNRPIMANVLDLGGVYLPAGKYWLDWQSDGSFGSGRWAPPITIDGQNTTGNALQYTTAWAAAQDSGSLTAQGFPFIIEGSVGGTGCDEPSDLPWASVSPDMGTTTAGNSQQVTVTFDSTGLTTGTYTGTLCVDSNAPASPRVEVPLTLNVTTGPIIYLPVIHKN